MFWRPLNTVCKSVYPSHQVGTLDSQRNVQYICLELLLSFVNDMAARANDVGDLCTNLNLLAVSNYCSLGCICVNMAIGTNQAGSLFSITYVEVGFSVDRVPATGKIKEAAHFDRRGALQLETQSWPCVSGRQQAHIC